MRAISAKMGIPILVAMLGTAVGVGWSKPTSSSVDKEEVERGRYLVEDVAMCGECHTPRDAQGEIDRHAWLQGATIWIMPVKRNPNWAEHAPALAGLPSYTDEEMERVLEKGIGPEGETLRPPMHIYHMNRADARAIIAYLKSLPTQKK